MPTGPAELGLLAGPGPDLVALLGSGDGHLAGAIGARTSRTAAAACAGAEPGVRPGVGDVRAERLAPVPDMLDLLCARRGWTTQTFATMDDLSPIPISKTRVRKSMRCTGSHESGERPVIITELDNERHQLRCPGPHRYGRHLGGRHQRCPCGQTQTETPDLQSRDLGPGLASRIDVPPAQPHMTRIEVARTYHRPRTSGTRRREAHRSADPGSAARIEVDPRRPKKHRS